MSIPQVIDQAKNLAAALGVGGVLWGAYASSGLPVPATIKQVDQRIDEVNETIKKNQVDTNRQLDSMRFEQIEGMKSIIRLTRVTLRNELSANQAAIGKVDTLTERTMLRRIGEIQDQLKELEASEGDLRARIGDLRTGGKGKS